VANGMKKIESQMKFANKNPDTKLLVTIYYSGHGVMRTQSMIVLNSTDPKDQFFPMEKKIETLSRYNTNTFVQLILDCCREKLPEIEMRGGLGVDDVPDKPEKI